MITPELEQLLQAALADGVVTDKERAVLLRKAEEAGMDRDEFEIILDARIVELKKANAPKSNGKHGDVTKCPACGAPVPAFTSRCPECGHEFSNVEAVRSANILFEKLQDVEMQKARELSEHETRKAQQLQALSERHNSGGAFSKMVASKSAQNEERDDLIRTLERGAKDIERKYLDMRLNIIKVYTVPNSKADLLELLSMATSSAYDNDGVIGPEEEVWLQKTDQIYQKIIIVAAGDQVTLNQATNMLVSLIKRLPAQYKNFTRIPKELRDKINSELKAQKADEKAEFKKAAMGVVTGWKGICTGVSLLLFIVGLIMGADNGGIFLMIGLVGTIVFARMVIKGIKACKQDLLYN